MCRWNQKYNEWIFLHSNRWDSRSIHTSKCIFCSEVFSPYIMKARTLRQKISLRLFPMLSNYYLKTLRWLEQYVQTERNSRKSANKRKITWLVSTFLYVSNGCTLIVYKSKPNYKVLWLSTKYKHLKLYKNDKKLPEICVLL